MLIAKKYREKEERERTIGSVISSMIYRSDVVWIAINKAMSKLWF